MACFLCRLICGPGLAAAMERWISSPWDQPNNSDTFFYADQNQQSLRDAYDLGKTEPKKSFHEFLNFAEKGSVWSMLQVGTSLLNGIKVPINRSEAEKWLRRAYEAGDEGAMLILANEYLHQKRFKDGEALLKGYPEKDYPPALYLMGYINLGLRNKAKAREMFERASALGHRRAKWSLSRLCTLGRFGIRSIPYGLRLGNEIGDEVRKGELEAMSRSEAAQNAVAAPAPVS